MSRPTSDIHDGAAFPLLVTFLVALALAGACTRNGGPSTTDMAHAGTSTTMGGRTEGAGVAGTTGVTNNGNVNLGGSATNGGMNTAGSATGTGLNTGGTSAGTGTTGIGTGGTSSSGRTPGVPTAPGR